MTSNTESTTAGPSDNVFQVFGRDEFAFFWGRYRHKGGDKGEQGSGDYIDPPGFPAADRHPNISGPLAGIQEASGYVKSVARSRPFRARPQGHTQLA
jgi:hypothetical protein